MSVRTLTGKIVALLIAVSLGIAGLLVSPARAASKVTVNIWVYGNVIEPKMIAAYKKIHPEVTLNIKKTALDQNHQNLIVAFQARQTPDIAAIEVSYSGLFRDYPQYFVDLRTLGASKIQKNFLAWRWAQGVGKNGSVIGIPTDVGGLAVAYRVDLFKKAGLPTNRTAVGKLWPTWDKFISVGQTFKKKTGKGFIDAGGTMFQAILNQGTELFYKGPGQVDYSNRQVKAAFTQTGKALAAGISARIAPYTGDWYAGLDKGAFGVTLAPAWQLDYIKQYAPKSKGKWDIATVPGGGGNLGGSQLTIPKAAVHKKEAWDFINWYLAPAQQLKVFKDYGLFPSTKVVYSNPAMKNYKDKFFNNAPTGLIYTTGALKLKPLFTGPKDRAIQNIFGQALGRIEAKKSNTSQAWNSALTTIAQQINR